MKKTKLINKDGQGMLICNRCAKEIKNYEIEVRKKKGKFVLVYLGECPYCLKILDPKKGAKK